MATADCTNVEFGIIGRSDETSSQKISARKEFSWESGSDGGMESRYVGIELDTERNPYTTKGSKERHQE